MRLARRTASSLAAVVALVVLCAGLVVGAVPVPAGGAPDSASAASDTTVYRSVGPTRFADTRTGAGVQVVDGGVKRIRMSGRSGVPADARAVVVTIAVDAPADAGYVVAWPAGSARPTAASLTFVPGEIRANSAVVQIGASGSIDVWTSVQADVIVDVSGAFVPATGARAGRYVPLVAQRALDTRPGTVPAGGSVQITAAQLGVPSDATAVAVNVTTEAAPAPGFFTAHPADVPAPNASILNVDRAGQTRGAFAIVPMSPTTGIRISSYAGGTLIVDVAGYMTGASAPSSSDGLFVPMPPTRIMDTRPNWIRGGTAVVVAGAPTGVAAMVANWTSVGASSGTYLTAYPANGDRPSTATVNGGPGTAVGNLGIVRVGGGVHAWSYAGEQLVVDLAGYITGPEAPPTQNGRELPSSTISWTPSMAFAPIINAHRAAAGLPPLRICDRLAAGAAIHATDNAVRRTMTHRLADGRGSQDVMAGLGYTASRSVVDNIAYSSAPMSLQTVFELWRASAAHNVWMLGPTIVEFGIAEAMNPDGSHYWALYLSAAPGNC